MLQAVVLCSKKNFQITKQGNAALYIEFIIVYITCARLVQGYFTDGVNHFQYLKFSNSSDSALTNIELFKEVIYFCTVGLLNYETITIAQPFLPTPEV